MATTDQPRTNPKPRKRIISAARSKDAKQPVSIRLTAGQVKELDAVARRRSLSRSDLIVQALKRCLAEDIWTVGEARTVSGNGGRTAYDQLVDLSNVLVALGFCVNEALKPRNRKHKLEAVKVLADARQKLAAIRDELQC